MGKSEIIFIVREATMVANMTEKDSMELADLKILLGEFNKTRDGHERNKLHGDIIHALDYLNERANMMMVRISSLTDVEPLVKARMATVLGYINSMTDALKTVLSNQVNSSQKPINKSIGVQTEG